MSRIIHNSPTEVAVPSNDRRRLERLCRYVARPPLALDGLEAMADGRLAYRLKTRWRHGTTHVVMERRELLERLAPHSEVVASSPPSRAHQVRYQGVLAPWEKILHVADLLLVEAFAARVESAGVKISRS